MSSHDCFPRPWHWHTIRTSKELLLNPVTICRNEHERCLIETSVNGVRVSIAVKQADEIESILCKRFTSFLMQRAEHFVVMRRKPREVSPRRKAKRKVCRGEFGCPRATGTHPRHISLSTVGNPSVSAHHRQADFCRIGTVESGTILLRGYPPLACVSASSEEVHDTDEKQQSETGRGCRRHLRTSSLRGLAQTCLCLSHLPTHR